MDLVTNLGGESHFNSQLAPKGTSLQQSKTTLFPLQLEPTGCPKKHVRCLSGYCEGAINAIFLSSRYLNGRDLNLEFGTEFE